MNELQEKKRRFKASLTAAYRRIQDCVLTIAMNHSVLVKISDGRKDVFNDK